MISELHFSNVVKTHTHTQTATLQTNKMHKLQLFQLFHSVSAMLQLKILHPVIKFTSMSSTPAIEKTTS